MRDLVHLVTRLTLKHVWKKTRGRAWLGLALNTSELMLVKKESGSKVFWFLENISLMEKPTSVTYKPMRRKYAFGKKLDEHSKVPLLLEAL